MAVANQQMDPVVFLDVKTTGHDREAAIIEIAAARVRPDNLAVQETYQALVRPEPAAHQTVVCANGWCWDVRGEAYRKRAYERVDWSRAECLEDVLTTVREFLGNHIVIGRDTSSHLQVLRRDYASCGISWASPVRAVDLLSAAVLLYANQAIPDFSWQSLLCWAHRRLRIEVVGTEGEGRALTDLHDAIDIFEALSSTVSSGLEADQCERELA